MPNNSPDPQVLELVVGLNNVISGQLQLFHELQAFVYALQTYVSEQPGYHPARFQQLLEQYRTNMSGQLQKELKAAKAALDALLKDFEGPPH